jgi:hypothetical protein
MATDEETQCISLNLSVCICAASVAKSLCSGFETASKPQAAQETRQFTGDHFLSLKA